MSNKSKHGFPDLAALAALDSRIEKLGAHYTTSHDAPQQPAVTHDAPPRDSAQQGAATLPAATHSNRVRVTTYVTPPVAAEIRALMAALDRPESWVANLLLTEALAARAKG